MFEATQSPEPALIARDSGRASANEKLCSGVSCHPVVELGRTAAILRGIELIAAGEMYVFVALFFRFITDVEFAIVIGCHLWLSHPFHTSTYTNPPDADRARPTELRIMKYPSSSPVRGTKSHACAGSFVFCPNACTSVPGVLLR